MGSKFQQQYHDRWVYPGSEYPETDHEEKWVLNPMYFFLEYGMHQLFQTMIIHDVYQHLSVRLTQRWFWFVKPVWPINLFEVEIRGEFFTFMLVPDMVKLISEQLKVFTSTTMLPTPTCHIMRSFVCKYFYPNWPWVVFQFRDGHMWNILVNK